VKIILAKTIRTMAAICTKVVQIVVAPKWHHIFLQNLFQPDNRSRQYVGTAPHHTSHKNQQTT
jgi:hypothetical protein